MSQLNEKHDANQKVLDYLNLQNPKAPISESADTANWMALGTHPDLVEIFWKKITVKLPKACEWVVYGRPVLIHPESGAIFGLASGTSTLALRLPSPEREEAFKIEKYGKSYQYPNKEIFAKDFGDDWALLPFFDKRLQDWCLSAYDYAGTL